MFYVFCDQFYTHGQKLNKIFILLVYIYVSNYLYQIWFLFGCGKVIFYTNTFYSALRQKKKKQLKTVHTLYYTF